MKLYKILTILFLGFVFVIKAQTNIPCLTTTNNELNYTTSILATPLSGSLNVVFIEFTFPDHSDDIEYYSSASEYALPGTYPDGSSIQDHLNSVGTIEKAPFLGEATIHFFETMSHGNINVSFEIPRNPDRSDGMWYTDNNYSTSTSRLTEVLRKVYDEFPSIIDVASYLVFYSKAYKTENLGKVPSIIETFTSSSGSVIFDGPITYGNFGDPHRPAVITHEIAHRIEYALDRSAPQLTFPDRGTDVTATIYNPAHIPNSVGIYNLASAFDLMYHNDPNSSHLAVYGQRPLISYDLIRLGWIAPDEILEIDSDIISDFENIKLYDMRKQLTAAQKDDLSSERGYRIVKLYLEKSYYLTRDEYYLIEYHKGTDYDSEFSNYDEGIAEGILIWHIVESSSDRNPGFDLLCAVPYNGFNYDPTTGNGAPLPDDSYPKTWETYSYPTRYTGIQKNQEFDWLNDLFLYVPRNISDGWGNPTNGGRQWYELTGVDGANWRRELPKKDDFLQMFQ